MEHSYTGKADWANRLRKGELTILASRPGVGIKNARLYKQLKSLDVLIIDYQHLLKIRSGANKAESLKMSTWLLDRAFLTIIKIADNSTKKIPLHFTHKSGFTVKSAIPHP